MIKLVSDLGTVSTAFAPAFEWRSSSSSPRFRSVLALMPLLALGVAAGCKQRNYNNARSLDTGVSSAATAADNDDALLVDSAPPSTTPPRDYTQDLVPEVANTSAVNYYAKIVTRAKNPPMKLAAKTVLNTLRLMRSLTHTKTINSLEGGVLVDISKLVMPMNPDAATALGYGRAWDLSCASQTFEGDATRLKCSDFWVVTPGDPEQQTLVGIESQHWSDLQAHFYAATSSRRHGCYTAVFRAARNTMMSKGKVDFFAGDDFPGATETVPATLRLAVLDICAWGRGVNDAVKSLPDWNNVDGSKAQFAEFYKWLWVEKDGKRVEDADAPKAKEDAQKRELVNVFDYVMLTQTFGFDLAQQEAVVNAFYSDFKIAAGGNSIDPAIEADCKAWRPVRGSPMDSTSAGKTRCQAEGRESVWAAKGY